MRRFHVGLISHIAIIIHARKYGEKLNRLEGPMITAQVERPG
jgi:hypothetical protein